MRPGPPGWSYQPPPHLGPRRRPELGGVAVLVVVTVLATLAAPHAHTLRGLVAGGLAELPAIGSPGRASATGGDDARADHAQTLPAFQIFRIHAALLEVCGASFVRRALACSSRRTRAT